MFEYWRNIDGFKSFLLVLRPDTDAYRDLLVDRANKFNAASNEPSFALFAVRILSVESIQSHLFDQCHSLGANLTESRWPSREFEVVFRYAFFVRVGSTPTAQGLSRRTTSWKFWVWTRLVCLAPSRLLATSPWATHAQFRNTARRNRKK